MTTDTTPWDAADFLTTSERAAAYLNAVFEDGDPATIAAALGDVARARGMSRIARDSGLAREALYRGLSEAGNPQLATVVGVLKSLGLRLGVGVIAEKQA